MPPNLGTRERRRIRRKAHRGVTATVGTNPMQTITLTKGQVAIVDDDDLGWLTQFNWCAFWSESAHTYRPVRGYRVQGKTKTVYMHRAILAHSTGRELATEEHVDHINHNGLDNRKTNLRLASNRENHYNMKKPRGCMSRFKGVVWCKRRQRWDAYIHDGPILANGLRKRRYIGTFVTELEAAGAYDAAAIAAFGQFALLNLRDPKQ